MSPALLPAAPPALSETVDRACSRVAPLWPLDRFIAVNPFWGRTHRPLPEVAAELRALSGAKLTMPRAWYRQAFAEGRFDERHLEAALERAGERRTSAELIAALELDEPTASPTRAKVTDVVDAQLDLARQMSWRDFVVNSISQTCAAYFDEGQAGFGPARDGGLYACWRRQAQVDRAPALLMELHGYSEAAAALPATAGELLPLALHALDVPEDQHERYLAALLLDVNGWAAWCSYQRWTARLEGRDDAAVVELLAVRLAWEWMLLRTGGKAVRLRWQLAMALWPKVDALAEAAQCDVWLYQEALELAWREPKARALASGLAAERPQQARVQAVFCIDVRSEPYRRALEAQSPLVQTLGFAGFFGMPIAYQPLGAGAARPQLPGLLAPKLLATDTGGDAREAQRRTRGLDTATAWSRFKAGAVSTFAFVEAMGLFSAWELLKDTLRLDDPTGAGTPRLAPRLTHAANGAELGVQARVELAEGILRAMSLTRGFAPLVLLCGHGSLTTNNPGAAGLDCGACCGQTGEVNARAAAALLNSPEVRAGLLERGLEVPAGTHFVAGLHRTTTDDVELFDLHEVPQSHAVELAQLEQWLSGASAAARVARATRLGVDAVDARHELVGRAHDWAEVRPEWGLANNAAFIVAPRERCRHIDLEGRAFLHDYRWQEDEGFKVLELIMTAPMVVTHFINFQYYASTVDNARYGSGDKLLHNVVGGHVGVFEGNGGDLRTGLPLQSLHDGTRWVHTPQRLCVFIEAPREAIDGVLERHAPVRALVENGWLEVVALEVQSSPSRAD